MVRTIKRANADGRWKVVSQKDPFSAADFQSTPAEFTCSRGTRGDVNPAVQRLERHPVDALPPDTDHDPVPRRLYLKQRFHGAWDGSLPGLQSTDQWWRCALGHTEECRIRVEGELRKTEERKARLRAAASLVGAPTGRALKRVRFAADRVGDDAETPATSASAPSSLLAIQAPSNLPAEAASSSTAPTPSVDPALPTSATKVPDQVNE